MKKNFDFFISYQNDDVLLARRIAEQLMANKCNVWFAEYAIGMINRTVFDDEISKGISSSSGAVCIISDKYFKSEFCKKEIDLLIDQKKVITCIQMPNSTYDPKELLSENITTIEYSDYESVIKLVSKLNNITLKSHFFSTISEEKRKTYALDDKQFSINIQGWNYKSENKKNEVSLYPNGGIFLNPSFDQSQITGRLVVERNVKLDLCFRDGTMDDAAFLGRVLRYCANSPNQLKCDGLHFLRINGFRHLAFTNFQDGSIIRCYYISFPQRGLRENISFIFSFEYQGTKNSFFEIAYRLDSIVTSLECSSFLCNYDETISLSDYILPYSLVQNTANSQASYICDDINNMAKEFIKNSIGNRMSAPGYDLINFNQKMDMLIKLYPSELSAAIFLKLPIGVQNAAIELFKNLHNQWDSGSHVRAAESLVCLLSLMDQNEARHLIYCMASETSNIVKKAAICLSSRLKQSSINCEVKTTSKLCNINVSMNNEKYQYQDMIYIPKGRFKMGTSKLDIEHIINECGNWKTDVFLREEPQQEVWLDSYLIDKYPITNEKYKLFIDATGYKVPYQDKPMAKPFNWDENTRTFPPYFSDHPVVLIDWQDAYTYAEWAGKRLPTEAEWEKAARGTDGRLWPWGNHWEPNLCNHGMNSSRYTTPVYAYQSGASPYGVIDMAGNVWEWCADDFEFFYNYNKSKLKKILKLIRLFLFKYFLNKNKVVLKSMKGGCFFDEYPELYRCSIRDGIQSDAWEIYRGFRCVTSC